MNTQDLNRALWCLRGATFLLGLTAMALADWAGILLTLAGFAVGYLACLIEQRRRQLLQTRVSSALVKVDWTSHV